MSFYEQTAKLFTKPIRANVLHSQWQISRAEMAEHIREVRDLNQWLYKYRAIAAEGTIEWAEGQIARHAQAWRAQIRLAMEAEAGMEAEGVPFDRGEGKWQ